MENGESLNLVPRSINSEQRFSPRTYDGEQPTADEYSQPFRFVGIADRIWAADGSVLLQFEVDNLPRFGFLPPSTRSVSWYLFDNSGATPVVIAFERAHNLRIIDAENYKALTAHYSEK